MELTSIADRIEHKLFPVTRYCDSGWPRNIPPQNPARCPSGRQSALLGPARFSVTAGGSLLWWLILGSGLHSSHWPGVPPQFLSCTLPEPVTRRLMAMLLTNVAIPSVDAAAPNRGSGAICRRMLRGRDPLLVLLRSSSGVLLRLTPLLRPVRQGRPYQ